MLLPLPEGWRVPATSEVFQWKNQIVKTLNEWDIVAFEGGKIDGHGYGNVLTVAPGIVCGHKLIIR